MHFSKSIVVLSIVAIGFINGNDDYDKGNIRVFSCPMWSTDTLPRFPVCARVIERTNEPSRKERNEKLKLMRCKELTPWSRTPNFNCITLKMNENQCCTEGAFQLPAENAKVQVIKLDAGIVRDLYTLWSRPQMIDQGTSDLASSVLFPPSIYLPSVIYKNSGQ
ncbi:hypothetical protein KEM48_011783 [Puccinia striiformis f. sp. tritici PST-130]|nr:hypothetical protein KEM48_011783 [Puccinia striiformis f. sp. tritici PST-130]